MDEAQKAYDAYFLALEGQAPAGLSAPPYRLQDWDHLPGPVRDAWVAAIAALSPPKPAAKAAAKAEG